MHVLMIGGHGALGKAMVRDRDWPSPIEVITPSRRRYCDATKLYQVQRAIRKHDAQAVVNLAAWTDVNGCQDDPERAVNENALTACNCAIAAQEAGIPCVQVSTDYAIPVWKHSPVPNRGAVLNSRLQLQELGVYGATKLMGERMALGAGAIVVRVAHLDPNKAKRYEWVNGYALANREWTERCAMRLLAFLGELLDVSEHEREVACRRGIFHLGPERASTVASLIAERWPDHPALDVVIGKPEDIPGWAPRPDTRFGNLWKPGDLKAPERVMPGGCHGA